MASNYSKLAGNIGADFQIDKTGVGALPGSSGPGPQLGHISGDLVVATDLTTLPGSLSQIIAQHVSSASQNSNTLTTFQMYQTRFVLAGSFSGGSVPNNTAAMRFLVCHTAGGSWAVGDIAFDNGLNDSTSVIRIPVANGYIVSIHGSNITGGSLPTLTANSAYIWDGSTFQKFISGYTGISKVIRIPFATADFAGGTLSSTATIPANATILRSRVRVYNGGTFSGGTVTVGYTGQASRLMGTTDSDLTTAGNFIVEGTTGNEDWSGTAAAVLVTLAGSPDPGGAGEVIVEYVVADV
jgi:hypothetical protein